MSQVPPPVNESAVPSASADSASGSASTPSSASLRSCVVCRTRRVRCDKQSPCGNCRRAGIACVVPSVDRPPRWARRFGQSASNTPVAQGSLHDTTDPSVEDAMEKIKTLESLVKDLRGQLEAAQAATSGSSAGNTSGRNMGQREIRFGDGQHSIGSSLDTSANNLHKSFGRLVLQDEKHSRYVSSGFWSEVNDELDMLMTDTSNLAGNVYDSSEDEALPGMDRNTKSKNELDRTPVERHAFLFQHNWNIAGTDLSAFHPPTPEIHVLLNTFARNVNIFVQVIHIPTVTRMIDGLSDGGSRSLAPNNEALLFSIYYAAITSMDDDDVLAYSGSTRADLTIKYRFAFEQALAKADFLNNPDIVLVQALSIFLALGRRHDSPRYVWMMIGLVIRMAHYLGLQRDGTHFGNLSPFEIEMRRRVWWVVCGLDLRAAEDQGTDVAIATSSFDTKLPLNINDGDISVDTKEMPIERSGMTDMSMTLVVDEISEVMRKMMAPGTVNDVQSLEAQSHHLDELHKTCEQGYFRLSKDESDPAYWLAVTMSRMIKAKMTLLIFLPMLFTSPGKSLSMDLRTKLLISAVEVAEYNHELCAAESCRQWRWLFQTCTHWHAVVYIMIEITRRRWSPIVERAWLAIHSTWLIPAQSLAQQYLRIWVPLRKLMAKVRLHRDAELARLRADPETASRLELEDEQGPLPASSGPFPMGTSDQVLRARWRRLIEASTTPEDQAYRGASAQGHMQSGGMGYSQGTGEGNTPFFHSHPARRPPQRSDQARAIEQSSLPITMSSSGRFDSTNMGYGVVPWLWADPISSYATGAHSTLGPPDTSMTGVEDVDWHSWIGSAMDVERSSSEE